MELFRYGGKLLLLDQSTLVDILHKQVGDPFMSVPSASVSIQTDQNIERFRVPVTVATEKTSDVTKLGGP